MPEEGDLVIGVRSPGNSMPALSALGFEALTRTQSIVKALA
jgi:hypothetical protein